MGAGFATVVTLVLAITPDSVTLLNAPRVTINAQSGDQFDPHVDRDLAAYSSSVDTLTNTVQEIRYFRFSTGTDSAIPNTLPGGERANDLLSDVDQGRIVFTRIFPDRSAIMLFDAAAQAVSELAPAAGSNRIGVAIGAQTVTFIDYAAAGDGSGEVMVLDLSTGAVTRLTTDTVFDANPAVSPDGDVITWERCATFANCDIFSATRTATGWTTRALTSALFNERSPDTNGAQVVLERFNPTGPTGSDLVLVPAAGGPETVLEFPGEQYNPSIRGQLVAFESRGSAQANSDIYLVDLANNRAFQITATPAYSESLNDVTVLSTGEVRVVWQANDEADVTRGNIYGATFTLPALPSVDAGTGGGGTGGGSGSGGGGGTTCLGRSATLEATRVYSPTHATDGVATFSAPFALEIPAEIPVTAGNAGNKKVVLAIDLGGTTLRCQYRGGSPKAHPASAEDLALAGTYRFVSCHDAGGADDDADASTAPSAPSYGAGTVVTAVGVRLHVQGGDSRQPLTQVALTVTEACTVEAQGDALAPDGGLDVLGCSSTSLSAAPAFALLALAALALRRPASIRVVARRERRKLQR